MASNKLNKSDVKSVSGGKSDATANKVSQAKQIVKEELKKESLAKAVGTGGGAQPANPQVRRATVTGRAHQLPFTQKGIGGELNQTTPICITPEQLS